MGWGRARRCRLRMGMCSRSLLVLSIVGRVLLDRFVSEALAAGVRWVFGFPDEGSGVAGRVSFLRAAGFSPVDDPDEEYPAMGRWT